MDPSLVTIIASAFGGAVLTGLVGLFTHWSAGRREARRWRLDLKYREYLRFIEGMESAEQRMIVQTVKLKEVPNLYEGMSAHAIRFHTDQMVLRKIWRWVNAQQAVVAKFEALLATHKGNDVTAEVAEDMAKLRKASAEVSGAMRNELGLRKRGLLRAAEMLALKLEERKVGPIP